MIPLSLEHVRAAVDGELRPGDGTVVDAITIDSRRARPGTLFVAVGGGRAFVDDALSRGAAAALLPEDAHAALAALAGLVRGHSTARVVGITGSTGKTSTKDVLAAICRPVATTVAAEEGHNNEIGVPLTLFRVEPDTEVVVAEMGMRGLGQIAALCEVARPQVGVVTGVGPVHLELLGTVERVARAKAEIVAALPPGGTAVIPAGEPLLDPYLRDDVETIRFGAGGDVRLVAFEPPRLAAEVGGERVELEVPFSAAHQAENTLAALAAYWALGLPLERTADGAREIRFSRWRGEEHELDGDVLLINDAYNANPVSMVAALRHLRSRAGERRAVAVLGEMAELGRDAPAYHRAVGAAAADLGVEVVAVGNGLASEYGGELVAGPDEAVALLRDRLRPGDVVLVKASRAAGLERVAEALR
ncbi:MAG TPA: UDP-N-acetylmuramoyl-tripeptide--D-alanyl-D-alanine ligase [Gaiellaceae bacterium]|nr:UDP-N-acetylmuramoyl-tripeptide--D-alanyl-D-alanine ligase [Gaiellaceae bacterium]